MNLKKSLLPVLAVAFMVASCNAQNKKTDIKMSSTIDSVSYGLGVAIGNNLKNSGFDSVKVDIMSQALKEVFEGKATMKQEDADKIIQGYMAEKEKMKGQENVAKGKAFLEENKKKAGVQTTASGMQYIVMKEGTGAKPGLNDKVTTHYHGTLVDGTVFDSSVERGQPASFPVSGVIPGWTEALQMMPVGSKWKLFLPSELAYGERGAGGKIGPNSVLVFEVELLSIDAPDAPQGK
ncbi:MAG: FKBP-type peptidyl-prolyl cis-trans isomerase [Bacteroidetes bacterium]|nr:FKBP-type peptidyl-prolyl cis-trans isomerase [Bacteroidota bacterium]